MLSERQVACLDNYVINDMLGINQGLSGLRRGDLVKACVSTYHHSMRRESELGDYFYISGYVVEVRDSGRNLGVRLSNVDPNYSSHFSLLRLLFERKPFLKREKIVELQRLIPAKGNSS